MNGFLHRRVVAMELVLAGGLDTIERAITPGALLSDAECVQACHDICHARPVHTSSPVLCQDDIAAVVAECRALLRGGHR